MAALDGAIPAIIGAANAAGGSHQVDRSLRFDSSSSTYLSRTPSSVGNRKTWTWSAWVKKGDIISSGRQRLFSVRQGTTDAQTYIQFRTDNKLYVEGPAIVWLVNTDAIFRDPGAWGHVVVAFDTTQATASNRVRIYWNGVEQTVSGTFPTLDYAGSHINNTILHSIGNEGGAVAEFFNGYLAEIHHVDGQQLAPTDFGAYDANNNWNPKEYSGSYGTNGFYLKFADNSSASNLGTDSSGNSNTWTVNNFSVAPGSGNDSLIDTPTNYEADSGNNGGNYCTLSPLKNQQTLSNGNLDVVGGSSWQRSVGTLGMFSGKYYWEYEITASNEHLIGVGPPDMQLGGNLGAGDPPGSGYGTELGQVNGTGANSSWSNTGGSTAGDLIGIAFDADNGNMYVYKNGSALNGGIASHTGLVMPQVPVVSLNGSSRSGVINFGQRPFAYTPPTGYVSLCTTNLAEPTIADGSARLCKSLHD